MPPAPPAPAELPTLPLSAAAGAVALTAASLVLSRFAVSGLAPARLPIPAYAVVAALVGYGPLVLYCWWVIRRWGSGRWGHDLGWRWRGADAGWGPLVYLGCLVSQMILGVLVTVARIPIESNTEGLDELAGDRQVIIAFLLTAVVAAPVVEELVFRGVVLRGLLRRLGQGAAVGVQGLLFGAAHIDPMRGAGNIGLVIVLSGVGIVLGAAALMLRRLGPTIIAHAIMNTLVMLVVLVIRP